MGILFTDEILIEPMRLFYLETYPGNRNKFFGGNVDYEATVVSEKRLERTYHDRSSRTSWKVAD
jgi:hypothetical protein